MTTFVSLFSGIGGFDLGFERAGMTCAAQVENNAHANQILAKHWPHVERFEDVKHVGHHNLPNVDVLCGGFPCQDVSVAGKRAGLAGERSGLWFEFLRITQELSPRLVIIENVPGLLSSNDGEDFKVILQGLVECGYRVTWRILDAQYFGVAQRRRRVFLVGSLGDGRSAEILFERESGAGRVETRPAAREDLAATVSASSPSRRNGGSDPTTGHFVVGTLSSSGAGTARTGNARSEVDMLIPATYAIDQELNPRIELMGALQFSSGTGGGKKAIVASPKAAIRRLTPLECERLQGFPDNWTTGLSDVARYRRLGNAVCVNVAAWLGERIVLSEKEMSR